MIKGTLIASDSIFDKDYRDIRDVDLQEANTQCEEFERLCKENSENDKSLDYDFDSIKNPTHYCEGREYEPRKVIVDWGLDFYLGNVVKYISRAGRKGNIIEDLKKARQYLDWEIELFEKKFREG